MIPWFSNLVIVRFTLVQKRQNFSFPRVTVQRERAEGSDLAEASLDSCSHLMLAWAEKSRFRVPAAHKSWGCSHQAAEGRIITHSSAARITFTPSHSSQDGVAQTAQVRVELSLWDMFCMKSSPDLSLLQDQEKRQNKKWMRHSSPRSLAEVTGSCADTIQHGSESWEWRWWTNTNLSGGGQRVWSWKMSSGQDSCTENKLRTWAFLCHPQLGLSALWGSLCCPVTTQPVESQSPKAGKVE